jgi:hypothetical protein
MSEGLRRIEYLDRTGVKQVTMQWGNDDKHAEQCFKRNCGGKETFIRILKDDEITHNQTEGDDE